VDVDVADEDVVRDVEAEAEAEADGEGDEVTAEDTDAEDVDDRVATGDIVTVTGGVDAAVGVPEGDEERVEGAEAEEDRVADTLGVGVDVDVG